MESKEPNRGRLRLLKGGGKGGSDSVSARDEAEVPLGETSGLRFIVGFIRRDKVALGGAIGIGIFFIFGLIQGILEIVADYTHNLAIGYAILPSNPYQFNFAHSLGAPSFASFPVGIFGYDYTGRSIISRILYAIPRDAFASVLVVVLAIVIGMFLGISAGYIGGWADEILMRVTDAFLAFPLILFAIALSLVLGNGYTVVLVALTVVWWPTYARFFRAESLTLKSRGYVEAAKLSGLSPFSIIVKHIFPNAIDPIVAIATLDFGNVILTYSTLAFLGIGVQVGTPELGAMAASGLAYVPDVWWYTLFPSLTIMAIVVCYSLLGDRIQDMVGGRLSY